MPDSDGAQILAFAHTSLVLMRNGEESLLPEMESNILYGAREHECSVY